MKTRAHLPRLLLLAVLALAAAAAAGGCRKPKPPNVVLIVIDALRPDHLSAYGHHRPTSPFLKDLASRGAIFLDAQAQATMTRISMPSLFTGVWPDKVLNFSEDEVLDDRALTMAEIFKAAGYQTGCVQTNPWLHPRFGVSQGFDFYETLYPEDMAAKQAKEAYRADKVIAAALEWIAGLDPKRPYFLYLHFMDVHMPYLPPPPYNRMFVDPNYSYRLPDFTTVFRYLNGPKMVETPPEVEKVFQTYKDEELLSHMRDLYDGEILYIDDQLRGLLGQIGGPGAIVALTADHGEEFKDHGELLHGKSLHQELTRVPLIFFAPGRVPGGTRVGSLARNVDIPPTLYELAGVPLPPNLDGQSLVPAWLAPGQADVPPAFAHIRHSGAGTDRDFAWEFAALTTTEWKLIKNLKTGELLLFDRRTDLAEKNNLAPSRPEKARELAGRLDAIIADSLKAKKALGIAETQKSPIDPKLRGQLNALGYFNQ